jgi:uncharacterized membrane protein YhhN
MRARSFSLPCALLLLYGVLVLVFYHYSLERAELLSPVSAVYPVLKASIVPLIGLAWHLTSVLRPRKIYLYILFSTIGDVFLMNYDFRIYAVGGVFFFLAHLTIALHFEITWRGVPLLAYVLMVPDVAVPMFFLVPQFRAGSVQAFTFAIYTALLEVGACSSVARLQHREVRDRSFLLCAFGYFLYVISDTLLIWGELKKSPYRLIQIEVMATYVAAQTLILMSAAADTGHSKEKPH